MASLSKRSSAHTLITIFPGVLKVVNASSAAGTCSHSNTCATGGCNSCFSMNAESSPLIVLLPAPRMALTVGESACYNVHRSPWVETLTGDGSEQKCLEDRFGRVGLFAQHAHVAHAASETDALHRFLNHVGADDVHYDVDATAVGELEHSG